MPVANTAPALPSLAVAPNDIANITKPDSAESSLSRKSRSQAAFAWTFANTSTSTTQSPTDPSDPLPTTAKILYFLKERTPDQQREALFSNPYYLASLIDWENNLNDPNDVAENNRPLVDYLPVLQDLIKEAVEHYTHLNQELDRLRATNNKLKEENNRLSTAPAPKHKDTKELRKLEKQNRELSKEIEDAKKQIKTTLADHQELRGTTASAGAALQKAINDKESLIEDLHNLFKLLPGVQNLHHCKEAIKGLQQTEKHSDQLVGELQNALLEWENLGLLLLPSEDGTPPGPLDCQIQAQNLINALAAAVQFPKRTPPTSPKMAGSSKTASGMYTGPELTQEDFSFFWKHIPGWLRKEHAQPQTLVDYIHALSQLGCEHPRHLGETLGDENQPWEESIEQVENLQLRNPRTTSTESRLFRASDVPRFTNTADYAGFRSSLLMFLESEAPPRPSEYGRALTRILSTFEDPVAQSAARGWKINELINTRSWEVTYRQFLAALDDKFQPATAVEDMKIAWLKCKPKDNEKPADFFNRFEAATMDYDDIRERSGLGKIANQAIAERLLTVLPRYLVNDARNTFARAGEQIELKTPKELRKLFEITWTYLPKPAGVGHNTKNNFQTGTARNGPAQKGQNEVRTMGCGMVCSYDTSPPVPTQARGSIYPDQRSPQNNPANLERLQYVLDNNLCKNCRRGPHEHKTVGAIFAPAKPMARTRRTRNTEEPPRRYNTVPPPPERLTIEAPPSRPITPLQ